MTYKEEINLIDLSNSCLKVSTIAHIFTRITSYKMNRKPKSRTNSVTNSFVIELSTAIIFKWNVLSLSNNDLTLEIMNEC